MATTLRDSLAHAERLLETHFGYQSFRSSQRRVLHSIFRGRDTLAVLPTGGGKSLCYQIPALVFDGLTIIVSPLIALMADQVAAGRARRLPMAALNSTLPRSEQEAVLRDVFAGRTRLLYLAPERLPRFAEAIREREVRCALLAVDEAHCISEWGHDFRPAYRRIRQWRARLGSPPAVALTGSATPAVRNDIVGSLGLSTPDVHVASFDRPNIRFEVVRPRSEDDRLRRLKDLLWHEERMTLVYAPTRSLCEALARAITRFGLEARPYHAGLTTEERQNTLELFLSDRVSTVVATSAFGMGIDKPDVRLVAHWTMPATPEAYYQEAGRAGRDGEPSRAVMLYRKGDAEFHRMQLGVTFPSRRVLWSVWRGDADPSIPENVLASARRLERELRPSSGAVDWRPVRRRFKAALARLRAMERYATGRGCRRSALLAYFGERLSHCRGCDRCGPSA